MAATVSNLRSRGLTIVYRASSGQIEVEPASRLTDELRAAIREQRAEIVAELVREASSSGAAFGRLEGYRDEIERQQRAVRATEADIAARDELGRAAVRIGELTGAIPVPWIDRLMELWEARLVALWEKADALEERQDELERVMTVATRLFGEIDAPTSVAVSRALVALDGPAGEGDVAALRERCRELIAAAVAARYGRGAA